MKFNTKVQVWSSGMERYVHSTHAANAVRMCGINQARRVNKSTIELTTGLAQVKRDWEAPVLPRTDVPKRQQYHQHTAPNQDRKTSPPHYYRADTGQIGEIRRVSFRRAG